MHAREFFGAILRANAKDRDFRRRSAANVRCRFPPTGGLFFRPLSHMQLCPPQPNSPPDTVIRAARPDFLIGACFKPCTTTHVRRAASRAQITASGMTGPGGPHRRASVARGHDAVLSLRYRSERFPERTAPASLPCSLGPRNGLPNRHRSRACRPPGTDSADTGQPRESTVQTLRSAVMRRVAAGGKLECVFPWKLAPSITRTGRASEKPGLTKPPTAAYRRGAVAVSRCLARTHCLS